MSLRRQTEAGRRRAVGTPADQRSTVQYSHWMIVPSGLIVQLWQTYLTAKAWVDSPNNIKASMNFVAIIAILFLWLLATTWWSAFLCLCWDNASSFGLPILSPIRTACQRNSSDHGWASRPAAGARTTAAVVSARRRRRSGAGYRLPVVVMTSSSLPFGARPRPRAPGPGCKLFE